MKTKISKKVAAKMVATGVYWVLRIVLYVFEVIAILALIVSFGFFLKIGMDAGRDHSLSQWLGCRLNSEQHCPSKGVVLKRIERGFTIEPRKGVGS